ncbi:MFS transporter [Corynebacterium glyciniphilum]|uniref:MFS transporter n=1 Tax=Corynebacterium glyciniphilum TaxID=1404244 RepID=UPI00264F48E8|nr:MFS transporter [Corynebacterium glyciniphilum]MDN6707170.1 MFS transporter [Corynebacterium glyciniphilum]
MSPDVPPNRLWMLPVPAVFLLAWGGNHFTPLLHLYETVGGYAPWQSNLLLGMYVFGLIPGLLVAAALSDRHGRRAVTLSGLVAAAVGSVILACGMSSFTVLCIGRLFAGVGVGVGMSVGSSWIKELSGRDYDPDAKITSGAQRSSLSLTLGFAIGAGVTGALAQWGPWPAQTPYVLHVLLCLLALLPTMRCPETVPPQVSHDAHPWWHDLTVSRSSRRPFLRVLVPAAPWVFAAAGIAYAVLPTVFEESLGDHTTIFATVLTVLTLGTGSATQPGVSWLNRVTRGRALPVGLVCLFIGLVLAAVTTAVGSLVLAFVAAVVLGGSFGVCLVAGLLLSQALATPQELAAMTGIYYSVAYLGFLLPTVLAALTGGSDYAQALVVVAVCCLVCAALVATGLSSRRK